MGKMMDIEEDIAIQDFLWTGEFDQTPKIIVILWFVAIAFLAVMVVK